MIAFGVGEMAGGLFEGMLVDKLGNQKSVSGLLLIVTCCGASTIWFNEVHSFTVTAYFMAFFWGCNDGAITTHISNLLGFEFIENDTPFSVCNVIASISGSVLQLVLIPVQTKETWRIFNIAALVIGLLCCSFTWTFDFKQHHRKIKDEPEVEQQNEDWSNSDLDTLKKGLVNTMSLTDLSLS
jgi:MFS family permease